MDRNIDGKQLNKKEIHKTIIDFLKKGKCHKLDDSGRCVNVIVARPASDKT